MIDQDRMLAGLRRYYLDPDRIELEELRRGTVRLLELDDAELAAVVQALFVRGCDVEALNAELPARLRPDRETCDGLRRLALLARRYVLRRLEPEQGRGNDGEGTPPVLGKTPEMPVAPVAPVATVTSIAHVLLRNVQLVQQRIEALMAKAAGAVESAESGESPGAGLDKESAGQLEKALELQRKQLADLVELARQAEQAAQTPADPDRGPELERLRACQERLFPGPSREVFVEVLDRWLACLRVAAPEGADEADHADGADGAGGADGARERHGRA